MRKRSMRMTGFGSVAAIALVACSGGSAMASMASGSLFQTPAAGDVSVSFLSQSAGAAGSLYFLGYESAGTITYAASSDSKNLGQFLFSNKGTLPGSMVSLGSFDAGARLHFAYLITNGVSVAPTGQVSRTDVAGDLLYFGLGGMDFEDGKYRETLGIEDIKSASSDFDYNDAKFRIFVTPGSLSVPAPGPVALACFAFGFFGVRRRGRG